MKLASLFLVFATAIPSIASADVINPPGGPVYVENGVDVDVDVQVDPPRRGERMRDRGQVRQRDPQRMAKRQRMRRVLIEQFDVNGDGRLGPRERMRAARVLHRIEQRLANPRQGQGNARRGQGFGT